MKKNKKERKERKAKKWKVRKEKKRKEKSKEKKKRKEKQRNEKKRKQKKRNEKKKKKRKLLTVVTICPGAKFSLIRTVTSVCVQTGSWSLESRMPMVTTAIVFRRETPP